MKRISLHSGQARTRSVRTIGLWLLCCTLWAVSCRAGSDGGVDTAPPVDGITVIAIDELNIITGQRIYVPAYSEIYYEDGRRTWDFAITLAIHNTDMAEPIVLRSVRYYDGNGSLVREYIDAPLQLRALATKSFTVARNDKTGGVGANFIVEWVAEQRVTPPVVEAVMISAAGQQGLSLISPGRVIAEIDTAEK